MPCLYCNVGLDSVTLSKEMVRVVQHEQHSTAVGWEVRTVLFDTSYAQVRVAGHSTFPSPQSSSFLGLVKHYSLWLVRKK